MKEANVKDICICCGACTAISELFEIGDKGIAEAKENPIPEKLLDSAIEASDCCPVGAIEIKDKKN